MSLVLCRLGWCSSLLARLPSEELSHVRQFRNNNKIMITEHFYMALFSGVHKLTALYNILQHFNRAAGLLFKINLHVTALPLCSLNCTGFLSSTELSVRLPLSLSDIATTLFFLTQLSTDLHSYVYFSSRMV